MKKLLLAAAAVASASLSAQAPVAPAQTALVPVATPATTAVQPAAAPATPAMTTGAGAATTAPADVAGIVSREFPAYDKNRDGTLDPVEFGDWMVKLKTIADPASTANAAAVKTWVNAAFAQADADRSKTLTLGELTGFLTPARS